MALRPVGLVPAARTISLGKTNRLVYNVPRLLGFVAPPPPAAVYLPNVGQSPGGVYFMRRVVAAYTGPLIQLQKADASTYNVAQAANGLPDYAAATTWAAGQQTRLRTVYDQSGNARNMTQTVYANMPLFDAAGIRGVATSFNSFRAMVFDGYWGGGANRFPKFMDVPTSVTYNLQAHTVIGVMEPRNALYNELQWQLRAATDGSDIGSLGQSQDVDGLTMFAGGGGSYGNKRIRQNYQVMGHVGSATAFKFIQDDTTQTAFVTSPKWVQAGAGIRLGDSVPPSADFYSAANYLGFVVYPAALSDANIALIAAALNSTFGINPVHDAMLVMSGDSILWGGGATESMEGRTYSRLIRPYLKGNPAVYNMGISAQTLESIAAAAGPREFGPGLAGLPYAKKVLYIQGGSNSFSSGTTAAQAISTVQGYIANARSAGYTKIVHQTVMDRSQSAPQRAEKDTYNAWVRSGASGAESISDVAAAATAVAPDIFNLTYYQDAVHPTGLLNSLTYPTIYKAINAVL